jgi:hypothetical protein
LNESFAIIVFSNHGGWQVNTTPPTIEVLENILNIVDRYGEGKIKRQERFEMYFKDRSLNHEERALLRRNFESS